MAALRAAVRRPMAIAFDDDQVWPERAEMIRTEHETIFAAIIAGDAAQAEALMGHQMEVFYHEVEATPLGGAP